MNKQKKILYKPFKYKGKGKFKMSVYVKNEKTGKPKLIHFGHKDYKHNYSEKARKSYLARSAGITDKQGRKTALNKNSKNYWARKVLWNA